MVIARPVAGKYRTLKNWANWVLFAIFLVLPFIRFRNGMPLILLDIPARKFFIFGLTIWPQEMYFLHILLLFSGFALFFVTALLGRIFCGYACPQTVFTEAYDWIGRLVSGGKLGKPSMTKGGMVVVYAVWIAISVFFSLVFLAYFKPYEEIVSDILQGKFLIEATVAPQAWVIFMVLSVGTAVFNMFYFRENMCNLVCPYGRFQTALLDRHSPIVSYNIGRGEPRRDRATQKVGQHKGDCIDDDLCVLVCPTGIDIRNGLQIGCLSCGLCADACTQVLGKFKKETLIDYRTIEQVDNPDAKVHYFRPRTVVYGTILTILFSVFTYLLVTRIPIYANAIKEKALANVVIPGEGWQNGYEVHVGNLSDQELNVTVEIVGNLPFRMIPPENTVHVAPGGYERVRWMVELPESNGKPPGVVVPLVFKVVDQSNPKNVKLIKSTFTFPMN